MLHHILGSFPLSWCWSHSLTLSRPICWQGKEKVKPRGSVCVTRFCFIWKSMMQSMMWSKSCG